MKRGRYSIIPTNHILPEGAQLSQKITHPAFRNRVDASITQCLTWTNYMDGQEGILRSHFSTPTATTTAIPEKLPVTVEFLTVLAMPCAHTSIQWSYCPPGCYCPWFLDSCTLSVYMSLFHFYHLCHCLHSFCFGFLVSGSLLYFTFHNLSISVTLGTADGWHSFHSTLLVLLSQAMLGYNWKSRCL